MNETKLMVSTDTDKQRHTMGCMREGEVLTSTEKRVGLRFSFCYLLDFVLEGNDMPILHSVSNALRLTEASYEFHLAHELISEKETIESSRSHRLHESECIWRNRRRCSEYSCDVQRNSNRFGTSLIERDAAESVQTEDGCTACIYIGCW